MAHLTARNAGKCTLPGRPGGRRNGIWWACSCLPHCCQLPRRDSSGQFLVCFSSVLPWDHSLSFGLSSDLHFSVLSSDLSILSFYTPCYVTSSRDLCFGHVFTVITSPLLAFFPTFPVIVWITVYPGLSHLVLLPQPCWTNLTSHHCSHCWAARVCWERSHTIRESCHSRFQISNSAGSSGVDQLFLFCIWW